jgi:hypothetical protein
MGLAAEKRREEDCFCWEILCAGESYACGTHTAAPSAYILDKILKARSANIKGRREYEGYMSSQQVTHQTLSHTRSACVCYVDLGVFERRGK